MEECSSFKYLQSMGNANNKPPQSPSCSCRGNYTSQPKAETLRCLNALLPLLRVHGWDVGDGRRRGYFHLDERCFFATSGKISWECFSFPACLLSSHKNKGESFEILQQKVSTKQLLCNEEFKLHFSGRR